MEIEHLVVKFPAANIILSCFWFINLRKSLEIQTSLISLDVSLNVLGEQGII